MIPIRPRFHGSPLPSCLRRSVRRRWLIIALAPGLLWPALEAWAIGGFSPTLFHFVSTRADDGTDQGGGWQQAAASLNFVDGRHVIPQSWSCQLVVGMPLRTARDGRIAPERAAVVSAEVATIASSAVMRRQPEWIPSAFCVRFCEQMRLFFKDDHPTLGARVSECR